VTDQLHEPPSPRRPRVLFRQTPLLIFGPSGLLFLGLFYYLSQLDVPTLQIVRTFTHPLIDHIGNVGNRLGDGLILVLISLGIGAVGFALGRPTWKSAAFHTLLAHGVAGLFTQTLKHTIGRPRPRLMQGQNWEMAPSFESGFDSFPSGHATASFAVATVLAYYFPKGKMVWFGLAAFVGTCRVIKGSHFPTDVLGGILVGIVTGLILVHPLHQWKEVFQHTLAQGLPWLITAFGLVWILVPHPGIELAPDISLFLGSMFVMTGLGLRLLWIRECSRPNSSAEWNVPTWPRVLMGVGLASSTGSWVIVGASLMAGMIWWMENQTITPKIQHRSILVLHPIWTEATLGIAMFLTTLLIFSIRSQLLLF
jgi:membrane-associated phospholipid phosphatase